MLDLIPTKLLSKSLDVFLATVSNILNELLMVHNSTCYCIACMHVTSLENVPFSNQFRLLIISFNVLPFNDTIDHEVLSRLEHDLCRRANSSNWFRS